MRMSTTFAKATQKTKTQTHQCNNFRVNNHEQNFLKIIAIDRDDKNVYDNISILQFELDFTVHCI